MGSFYFLQFIEIFYLKGKKTQLERFGQFFLGRGEENEKENLSIWQLIRSGGNHGEPRSCVNVKRVSN